MPVRTIGTVHPFAPLDARQPLGTRRALVSLAPLDSSRALEIDSRGPLEIEPRGPLEIVVAQGPMLAVDTGTDCRMVRPLRAVEAIGDFD